jgi:hypothetical protein
MRKPILTTAALAMAGISPGFARGGHAHSMGALSSPANPAVPPSLTPDASLAGSAPLPSHRQLTKADNSAPVPPDAEDAKVDEMIKSISRGCYLSPAYKSRPTTPSQRR